MDLYGVGGWLLSDECKDEEMLLVGPAGSAKTVGGCMWLLNGCIKYPGSRHLLARATRKSLTAGGTLRTMDSVIGKTHPEVQRVSQDQRTVYRLFGSEILCVGLDEPGNLFGSGFGRIVIEEAVVGVLKSAWELFGRAARDSEYRPLIAGGGPAGACPHQRLAITNPGDPGHWLNTRATREPAAFPDTRHMTYRDYYAAYEYSTGPQKGQMRRLLAWHQDNPIFFNQAKWKWLAAGEKYLDKSLGAMEGFNRARMLSAKWVSGVGDPVFDLEGVAWMKETMKQREKESPTLIAAGSMFVKPPTNKPR